MSRTALKFVLSWRGGLSGGTPLVRVMWFAGRSFRISTRWPNARTPHVDRVVCIVSHLHFLVHAALRTFLRRGCARDCDALHAHWPRHLARPRDCRERQGQGTLTLSGGCLLQVQRQHQVDSTPSPKFAPASHPGRNTLFTARAAVRAPRSALLRLPAVPHAILRSPPTTCHTATTRTADSRRRFIIHLHQDTHAPPPFTRMK
jgi:hypothetical protein